MLCTNMVICANQAAFQQTEITLHRVGMNIATAIFSLAMFDNVMTRKLLTNGKIKHSSAYSAPSASLAPCDGD